MRTLIILALSLAACGKSGGGGGSPVQQPPAQPSAPYTMAVAGEGDLPPCTDTNKNQLIYVKDKGSFRSCEGGSWQSIEIKGEKGDPAQATKIASSIYCTGDLNANNGVDFTGFHVDYWATVMSSGDVWASGYVKGSAIQIGASRYWAASQSGAATAAVAFTDDIYNTPGSGWWNIEVNRETKVATATFNDVEMPTSGTRTWTFPATACTFQTY